MGPGRRRAPREEERRTRVAQKYTLKCKKRKRETFRIGSNVSRIELRKAQLGHHGSVAHKLCLLSFFILSK